MLVGFTTYKTEQLSDLNQIWYGDSGDPGAGSGGHIFSEKMHFVFGKNISLAVFYSK